MYSTNWDTWNLEIKLWVNCLILVPEPRMFSHDNNSSLSFVGEETFFFFFFLFIYIFSCDCCDALWLLCLANALSWRDSGTLLELALVLKSVIYFVFMAAKAQHSQHLKWFYENHKEEVWTFMLHLCFFRRLFLVISEIKLFRTFWDLIWVILS